MQNALAGLRNVPRTLFLLLISLWFPITTFAQTNEPQVTFAKTAAGYYWPLGSGDFLKTCAEGNGGTWLGRDSAHGGCYKLGVYHIGYDMFFAQDDSLFGHAVYAIATGTVVYISKNDWGDGNVGIFVRHTYKDPFSGAETDFLALYGHVLETVAVGDIVTGGVQFTTIGHYPGTDHLHFGIHPATAVPPNSPYGMMPNSSWPTGGQADQNGFVDPVAFITNSAQPPKCMNGSSERYRPGGNLPFHPDGSIVKVRQTSADFPHPETVYVLRGNLRYRIPSQGALNTLYGTGRGFDFRDVITVSPDELKQYKDAGTLLTPLPDNGKSEPTGRLIQQWGSAEISIVTRYLGVEGVRIPFSSGSNFLNLGYAECNVAGSSDYYTGYVTPQNTTVENMSQPTYTAYADVDPIFSTASAAAIPNPPQIGQATGIGITLLNANTGSYIAGTANDRIVDLEIYNSTGTQVFQYFFEHQFFTKDSPETYQITWTPQAAGTYTVKVGVFQAGWAACDYWNDSAVTLSVGSSSPPSAGAIDIWWPTDGSSVSGTQPFKALLENNSLSQYAMYWQVDGGGLVPMYDSSTDYPHKEAMVDLSGWNWRGTGPYTVNFVAKDSSGNVLAQKSVGITVSQ